MSFLVLNQFKPLVGWLVVAVWLVCVLCVVVVSYVCCGCGCGCGCGLTRWCVPVCTLQERPCVYRHHAHMCFNMSRGRFESTHGVPLFQHTTHTQKRKRKKKRRRTRRSHRQFCLPKFAHVGLSRAPEVHRKKPLDDNSKRMPPTYSY